MVIEDVPACAHKLIEDLAVLTAREIFLDALTEDIVRAHEIVGITAALPENAVAVADTRVKAADIVSESGIKCLDKLVSLRGGYLVGAVVKHYLLVILTLVGKGDDVAAVCNLILLHFKSHTDRLQRRATLGVELGIKGEDRHICGVAFGNHAARHV